jgi:hypothetical protein
MKENYYSNELKQMNYFTDREENYNIFAGGVNEMNEAILKDFYKAIDWLLGRQYEEYTELDSNTINPAQQNAFMPLRTYRVKRNGHLKLVSIYHRFMGGCWITEENY